MGFLKSQLATVGSFAENLPHEERLVEPDRLSLKRVVMEAFQVTTPGVTEPPVMLPLNARSFVALIAGIDQMMTPFETGLYPDTIK